MTHHTFTSPKKRLTFAGVVHELDGQVYVRERRSLGPGAPGLSEEPGALLSTFTRGGWIVQPPIPTTAPEADPAQPDAQRRPNH